MEAVVEQLRNSPKLAIYLRDLGMVMQAEQAARLKFREELTEDVKAEFINGEVFVHSPVKNRHASAVGRVIQLLGPYVSARRLGKLLIERALVCLTRNDYEPDVCFWSAQKAAGFREDQMEFPAPDLIVEVISPSTEKHDRVTKFEDYAAHGIREYWLIDPESQVIEQYILKDGQYALVQKTSDGTIRSEVLSGLSMPARAAFDDAENLACLKRILAV